MSSQARAITVSGPVSTSTVSDHIRHAHRLGGGSSLAWRQVRPWSTWLKRRVWQTSPTCAGKRGARFVVIALAAYLLWSGPHRIFHAAHQHADSALSVA